MILNLNEFLMAVSKALDFIEEDLFGVPTNHSKRITLIALKIGKAFDMTQEELYDLASMSLLHDNGASLKILHDNLRGNQKEKIISIESMQEHCIIGEENVRSFPFLTKPINVIKYHHEHYDGSGFFGLSGADIPLMSQIIRLADQLDLTLNLPEVAESQSQISDIIRYLVKHKGTIFSPVVVEAAEDCMSFSVFWDELKDESIDQALADLTPAFYIDYDYKKVRDITKTFSKVIDAKTAFTQFHSSSLAKRLEIMVNNYYEMDSETVEQLLIAADLHDLGKLAINNKILDKPSALSAEEFLEIQRHPQIGYICLQQIKGFEKISEWVHNHHEKLDGTGYPRGINQDSLDFPSRLLACVDIYQAIREERPYRPAMSHEQTMDILAGLVADHKIDRNIVNDIDKVFG
ncbi:HD family phosphohydrolase [Desulfuribacillus stibiiarsenatis]|uniref:HD family phosphohydrolase n=1 Tax=Desulfuribacillus stibiiarsenatis TaxID=1390249 RepID=A0A1E5L9R2_9FIRM|nr:HD domain-containing phosphohydrolase [Desulfuribacillus stibiiarsenatis]OEH86876.1 HD family phosphohydrolase [Desulfuribacillus stibiiarsenatis]